MPLLFINENPGPVLAVKCEGKLTKRDFDGFLSPAVERMHCEHEKIRILFQMTHFKGVEVGAVFADLLLGLKHFRHIERIAIVGHNALEGVIAALAKPFVTAKYFEIAEESLAYKWVHEGIEDGPVSLEDAPKGIADCPVSLSSTRRFLVCLDGSQASNAALEHAISLMNVHSDELILIAVHQHEREVDRSGLLLTHAAKAAKEENPCITVRNRNVYGDPALGILAAAEECAADYICMGSHAKVRMVERVLGSVTQKVSRSSLCPVLVVPPPRE